MAQEITANVSITITVSGQTASGTTQFKGDLTGDYIGQEQTIGTTAEAITLLDVGTVRCVYVRNMDATNFVQVDSANTFDKFPQKLLAGDAIMLVPETGTIYAKADTASVKIWVVAG